MVSTQESIENCSICQNSRKKHFLLAPNNYGHIFGYLGPVSKTNIKLLNSVKQPQYYRVPSQESTYYAADLKENTNHHHHHVPRSKDHTNHPRSKEKHNHHKSPLKESAYCQTSRHKKSTRPHPNHVKESTSELSRLIYKKNLNLKKDINPKWMEPSLFLYNFKSRHCDETKMRYDESDTDFEDLKIFKKRSTKTRTRSKKRAPSNKKSKPKKLVRKDSSSTYGTDNFNCPSLDSLSKYKVSKVKKKRLDPEDVETRKSKKRNENMENMDIRKKCTIDNSTISVDSTKAPTRRSPCRTDKCSTKIKNLKHTMKDILGSMESIQSKKNKRTNNGVDPEDADLILMPWKKEKSRKNTDHCHRTKKKRSTSSTDLSVRGGRLNEGFFDSIDTIKNHKSKKRNYFRYDKEDNEALLKLPLSTSPHKSSKAKNQKANTKGWIQNFCPKKKEVNPKCTHCKDPKTCGHQKRRK